LTELLPATPDGIARAVGILAADGLVCFPTDTVYGLACLAQSAAARERFYQAKARDPAQPAIVMAAALAALEPWVEFGEAGREQARRYWPGPLTLVLPATAAAVEGFGQVVLDHTLGVRIPDHQTALALLAAMAGPLATSSANVAGAAPPRSAVEAMAEMEGRVEAVIDGACPLGLPSSILDLTGPQPRVIREGAIPAPRLLS
jgi:L-threonylcarbamoyladenylate synthase